MSLKETLKVLKEKIKSTKKEETKENIEEVKVKEFSLEVILSFTNGLTDIVHNDKIKAVSEQMPLIWFLNEDLAISDTLEPYLGLNKQIVDHLIMLYPELRNVKYDKNTGISIQEWMNAQKQKFGETLPVCKFGMNLDDISKIK